MTSLADIPLTVGRADGPKIDCGRDLVPRILPVRIAKRRLLVHAVPAGRPAVHGGAGDHDELVRPVMERPRSASMSCSRNATQSTTAS